MNMSCLPRKFTVSLGFAVLLGLGFVGLPGCSKEPGGQLKGKVTYQDKPVGSGTITLYPSSGSAIPAGLATDGTYTFTRVPPGDYKVTIISLASMAPPPGVALSPENPTKDKPGAPMTTTGTGVKLPDKYSDPKQTPLSLTVKEGKNEPHDFNLTD